MYLPSTHTSPLIAQALNDIIISWRIDKKVMSITTDNGPNMVAAFKKASDNTINRPPVTERLLKKKFNSKKTSWVWELMESTEIEEEGSIIKAAICKINVSKTSEIKYCNIIVHGGSDSSTSNFINHLTSVHGLTKDNYETKLNSKEIPKNQSIDHIFKKVQHHPNH
ncbi:17334_t:CDS:2 [Entrophospora sp. SA101]|nr:17334_t:CDS:2 [Entrophospora sp. SA101]